MKNDIQWRRYQQSEIYYRDLDAVVLLHAETESALGRRMQLPDLMKPPVLEAWVAERDGIVVGGMYCEAIIEPVFFGRDPVVTASARRFFPGVLADLRRRGFHMVRMEVPRWIGQEADAIGKELEAVGFVSTDPEFLHFRYDLQVSRGGTI